jgi:hypothetical protein
MFQLEHISGFAIVCTKCSNWNITAFLPEHCGNLGKLGKQPESYSWWAANGWGGWS